MKFLRSIYLHALDSLGLTWWVGSGTLFSGILSYFFILFVARRYSLDSLGEFSANLAAMQILGTIATLGIDQGFVKFCSLLDADAEKAELLKWTALVNVVASITIGSISVFIFSNIRYLILSPYLLFFSYSRIIGALFIVSKKPMYYFLFNVGDQLLRLILFLALSNTRIAGYGAEISIVISLLTIDLFFTFLVLRGSRVPHGEVSQVDLHFVFRVFIYSFPLFVSIFVGFLLERLPVLLIRSDWTNSEAGLFTASQKIILLLGIVPVTLNYLTPQKFVELAKTSGRASQNRFLWDSIGVSLFANFVVCSIFFCFAEEFLSLFGRDFIQSAGMLRILIIYQFLASILFPVQSLFQVSDKPIMSTYNQIISIMSFFVAFFFLKEAYGVLSIAYALVISSVASNVFKGIVLKRFLLVDYSDRP